MPASKVDSDAHRRAIMDRIAQACVVTRRAAWGARPAAGRLDPDWSYNAIVVHYTGHDNLTTMKAIQDFDLDHRHWDDIAYHYAITPGGRIFEGRELLYKGSHVRNQNTGKIGIVCMGDFDSGIRSLLTGHGWQGDPVRSAMLDSLRRLSRVLQSNFPISIFGGHKEFGDSETCPGDSLLPAVVGIRGELKLAAPVHRSL
ncbi:MAG: N-acetylmuramoyl-L-alanine amidase [Alphaproteobacteria bacterium]|nr:MAG: N-acetylmuramoyl-L-alanine amidase [Alphaproteobacteria bacterium]